MKRFFSYIGVILLGSFLLSCLVAFAFDKLFLERTPSHISYKLSRFYEFEDDILFMGSSRAEQCFLVDSMFEGDNAYNYGMVGTGNWLWPKLLKDAQGNGKKELILVNVDPPSFDHGESWNTAYYLKVPRETSVFKSLDPKKQRAVGYFPFQFFGRYIELFRTGIKHWYNITAYEHQGTVISIKKPNPGMFYAREFVKDSTLICKQEDLLELKKDLTDQSEDVVIFLKLPSLLEAGDPVFFDDFKPVFEDVSNVHFMDYTGALQDSMYWYDHVHFNLLGADMFSEMLREDLKQAADSGWISFPESVQFK